MMGRRQLLSSHRHAVFPQQNAEALIGWQELRLEAYQRALRPTQQLNEDIQRMMRHQLSVPFFDESKVMLHFAISARRAYAHAAMPTADEE